MSEEIQWYVLRTKYCKEKEAAEKMSEIGRTFLPPSLHNLFFVLATRSAIEEFLQFSVLGQYVYFYWDKNTHEPALVRPAAMDAFIRICEAFEMPIVLSDVSRLKVGDRVRVKEGPLAGIEGNIVRIKKSRRILVNVDNVLWAATEFVNPEMLEVIEVGASSPAKG